MKKRVGIFGLVVLAVMLFCTPDKLPEQIQEKSESKQYTAAPISSSEIAKTKTVSSDTDMRYEIPVTIVPIISAETDEVSVVAQECMDVMAESVENDAQIEPYEPNITTTEPASPVSFHVSRL